MDHCCTLHPDQILTLYCDSCKDAVCQLCTQLGPHADSRHIISKIQEAAQLRRNFYMVYLNKQVLPLKQKVLQYLMSLSVEQQLQLNDRRVIEKDITLQFEGMAQRVNQVVDQQIIRFQTEIKNYQEIINRCDDLAYSFDNVVQFPQRFLLCYKQFHQLLKQLENMNLPFKRREQFEIIEEGNCLKQNQSQMLQIRRTLAVASKLPRQMAHSLALAAQLPLYRDKNIFLNKLVVKATEYYKQQLAHTQKSIIQNQKKILFVFNNHNTNLLKLQSAHICAYCLTPFSMDQVNEACVHNKSYKSQPNYKDIVAPPEVRGTKMHYWTHTRKSQRKKPDIKSHSLVINLQKKQYLSSLIDLRLVKCKLNEFDIKRGKPLAYLDLIKKSDPQETGKVTPLSFLFLMTNKFEVEQIQVQFLTELCQDKDSGMIDYTKMESIFSDPVALHKKFIQELEQLEKAKPVGPPSFKFRY